MDMKLIVYIGSVVLEALIIGVPTLFKIIKDGKALKTAKTNEEKMTALEDMKTQAKTFIEAAEIAFKELNNALKAQGSSAGSIKKDSVLLKLQSYAAEKNYIFDIDFWSQQIDELVAYTKNVNSK